MSNRQQRKLRKEHQRAQARLARGEAGDQILIEYMRARLGLPATTRIADYLPAAKEG